MRKLTVLALLSAAFVAAPAGAATTALTYKGQATSTDRSFKYGKVTIKRKGTKVTNIEIKAVTANCSGQSLLRTIVFRAGNRDHKVISGSPTIKGGKMKLTFLPEASVEDVQDTIEIKFSGSKATGKFVEKGLCSAGGVFTAKR